MRPLSSYLLWILFVVALVFFIDRTFPPDKEWDAIWLVMLANYFGYYEGRYVSRKYFYAARKKKRGEEE